MSAPQQQPQLQHGIVKQILSGDAIVVRGQPKGGPPPERTIYLANITAPKLARRPAGGGDGVQETKDEPFAWEAREFLRKKLIGKEVTFVIDYKAPASGREYGYVYLGRDTTAENISESIVKEGLVEVRKATANKGENHQKLCELEESAKSASKGKWDPDASSHVREVKWSVENPRNFVDMFHQKEIDAVIEHVRDGSTMRAILLPSPAEFYHITLMLSGIRCPAVKSADDASVQSDPFAEEAKYCTESRLLQRDVKIILESVTNQNFFGTVRHPNGNIAEVLLREGFARCVDWSITFVTGGAEKLRAAEKMAKEKRIRIWKDYCPTGIQIDSKDKEFQGKVMEVVNADALVVKTNDGTLKKIFLASIRPPRLPDDKNAEIQKDNKSRNFRPLYDIPFMYDAREYLRKKLIGKKVNVSVDYIQPASNSFPEKTCCTVKIGGVNVAEALVSKGLATVVRYRQDDDQRSTFYDELLAAEMKAQKSGKGLHSKKEITSLRVVDLAGDLAKSKQFLPFLQRAGKMEAVVEFVASGSRLRLYIPRENCLVTFLLAGISCPRASRPGQGGVMIEGEPFGEEALQFTKELCHQKEVEVEVEAMDKAGNFIGWLTIDSINLSEALVKEGLAAIHYTAERSPYFRALQIAEDSAKKRKDKIWAGYEETKEVDVKEESVERKVNYKSVVVTAVKADLTFYAQFCDDGAKLEELMQQLRQDFTNSPPLPGAYTPKKNDLCAAKFVDGEWYRAKVEKVSGNQVSILFVDYGNRETVEPSELASLPSTFHGLPYGAHEFGLACVALPKDPEAAADAQFTFSQDTCNQVLQMNVEYRSGGVDYVTLVSKENSEDVAKSLISEGYVLVESRKEKRLQDLLSDYKAAEETAKRNRLKLWCYGDFTEDDAKEFGFP